MRLVHALTLSTALLGAGALAQDVGLSVTSGGAAAPELVAPLRGASLTAGLGDSADAAPQDYVAAARADYRRILTALYAEGYYGGTVSIRIDGREAAGIAPLDAPVRIERVDIAVETGPRFTFATARVGPLPTNAALPDGFASGQTARSGAIGEAVRAGVAAWREEGHAKAAPDGQKITARHATSELDVDVRLAPGPRLSFGHLAVTGNEAVRAERIREIAGLPEGEIFSPQQLDAAANRLRRTGAFASVAMVEGDAQADLTLPVTAQVAEQIPRRFGAGAEISTVEGLSLSAFWLHRNLLGGAERFRLEGEVTGIGGETGGVDYALGYTFNRPASFGPLTDLYSIGRVERVDDPGYFLDQVSLELGVSRQPSEAFGYDLGVGFLAAEVDDDLGARSYSYLTLPAALEWDRRDDALDTADGHFLRAELTPFVSLDSDATGGRLFADGRIYRSLGPDDRLTLAARGQVGAVFGVSAEDAPADFLFFSGGGGSVRGQPYQSLGVDLGGGSLIGGRGYLGAQLEARYAITDKIGAVAFYDAGRVGPDPFSDVGSDWHAGAGLGVRYETGIGQLRLDLGVPTTGASAGETIEVYIGIGQSF